MINGLHIAPVVNCTNSQFKKSVLSYSMHAILELHIIIICEHYHNSQQTNGRHQSVIHLLYKVHAYLGLGLDLIVFKSFMT